MSSLSLVNPYSEAVFDTVEAASSAEIDQVVDAGRAAFAQWRRATIDERVALCSQFVEAFRAERESIARDVTLQMGKPLAQARGEVDTAIDRAEKTIA